MNIKNNTLTNNMIEENAKLSLNLDIGIIQIRLALKIQNEFTQIKQT